MIKILFIDDDPNAQKTLSMILSRDYHIISAYTGEDGLEKIESNEPDIILLDINLPGKDGIEILKIIKELSKAPPVIMMTTEDAVKTVVEAIRFGAYDYLLKPFDIEDLKGTIWRAIQNAPIEKTSHIDSSEFSGILGDSPAIRQVKEHIFKYAQSDAPVIITGESGTGKELVAEAVHRNSFRKNANFVAINCGAIPETLVESELFGSEKGAFTDAVKKAGCFERANGGSLFLDEIGEMPLSSQVKLLRVLEKKEIIRVGGSKRIPLNIRIITATNRDLKERVKNNEFREDLYYRLFVLPIKLPPLRERIEDIPVLSAHFVDQFSEGKQNISQAAIDKLKKHQWLGNIRQLRNVIQRAVLLAQGETIKEGDIIID